MGSLAFQWLQLPLSHLEGKGFCSNTPLLQGDKRSSKNPGLGSQAACSSPTREVAQASKAELYRLREEV